MPDKLTGSELARLYPLDSVTREAVNRLSLARQAIYSQDIPPRNSYFDDQQRSDRSDRAVHLDLGRYQETYYDLARSIWDAQVSDVRRSIWMAQGQREYFPFPEFEITEYNVDSLSRFLDRLNAENSDKLQFRPAGFTDGFFTAYTTQHGEMDDFHATTEIYLGDTLICVEKVRGKAINQQIKPSLDSWEQKLTELHTALTTERERVHNQLQDLGEDSNFADIIFILSTISQAKINGVIGKIFDKEAMEYVISNINLPWFTALAELHNILARLGAEFSQPQENMLLVDYAKAAKAFKNLRPDFDSPKHIKRVTAEYERLKPEYDNNLNQVMTGIGPQIAILLEYRVELMRDLHEDASQEFMAEVDFVVGIVKKIMSRWNGEG